MSKKITFHPSSQLTFDVVPPPVPARKAVASWYGGIPFFYGGEPSFVHGEVVNKTVKACVPFADAMASGYVQQTWCDIRVVCVGDDVHYEYSSGPPILKHRDRVSIPVGPGYQATELVWQVPWMPKVPHGWSVLFCHPANRFDLPFASASGLVDSDRFWMNGNLPLYVKKGFSGIIPAGTPMYQMIPVRRDSWRAEAVEFSERSWAAGNTAVHRHFWGTYRRVFHVKKEFR